MRGGEGCCVGNVFRGGGIGRLDTECLAGSEYDGAASGRGKPPLGCRVLGDGLGSEAPSPYGRLDAEEEKGEGSEGAGGPVGGGADW